MILLTLCIYVNRYLFLAQPSSQKTILRLLSNNFLTSNLFSFDIMMTVHVNVTKPKAECPAWETSYSNTNSYSNANTSLSRRRAPGNAQNPWLLKSTDCSLLHPPYWLYTYWWLSQKQVWSDLTHRLRTHYLRYKSPCQMYSTFKACLSVHLCSKILNGFEKERSPLRPLF